MENKYSLLLEKKGDITKATRDIDTAINGFKRAYKAIHRKWRKAGLGDTMVADLVKEEVFNKIHYEF